MLTTSLVSSKTYVYKFNKSCNANLKSVSVQLKNESDYFSIKRSNEKSRKTHLEVDHSRQYQGIK